MKNILGFDEIKKKKVEDDLDIILEHVRGELEEIGVDNPDYDADLANIGKEDKVEEESGEVSENEEEVSEPKNNKEEKQSTLI